MKKMILAVVAVASIVATGCVHTVTDSHAGAIWFGRDKFEEHFPRSVEQVYSAAYTAVSHDGAVISEYIPHDTTNEVRALQARVNNCNVYIRVESVSPQVSDLIVQARTLHDTSNAVLANQLDTEIAVALTQVHRSRLGRPDFKPRFCS